MCNETTDKCDNDPSDPDDLQPCCEVLYDWAGNGGSLNCCGDDSGEAGPYEAAEQTCNDNQDNDCDGLIDMVDIDCAIKNISQCGVLSQANTLYNLNSDIVNNTLILACINITAENITLDCQGHSISSINSAMGVYSCGPYTTIRNCEIDMGEAEMGYGIGFRSANNSYIYDNILNNQHVGIYPYLSFNITVRNNTFNSNTFGLYISEIKDSNFMENQLNSNKQSITLESSHGNTLEENIIKSSDRSIRITNSSTYNTLINNNLWDCSNITHACLELEDSHNNIISGGLINLSENILIHFEVARNNRFENLQLLNSQNHSVLVLGSPNNVFNNLVIYSPNSPRSGIASSNSTNTTITNCNITMGAFPQGYGIGFNGAHNSLVSDNNLNGQYVGLYLYSTYNTRVERNIVNSNFYGFMSDLSLNNILINNQFCGNTQYDTYCVDGHSITNNYCQINQGCGGICTDCSLAPIPTLSFWNTIKGFFRSFLG